MGGPRVNLDEFVTYIPREVDIRPDVARVIRLYFKMKPVPKMRDEPSRAAIFFNTVIKDTKLSREPFRFKREGTDAATSIIQGWARKKKSSRGEPLLAQTVFYWFFMFVREPSYFMSIAEQTWKNDDILFRNFRRAKEGMTKDDPLEEVVRRFRSEREAHIRERNVGGTAVRDDALEQKIRALESVEQKAHAKALYLEFLRASLAYPIMSTARHDRDNEVDCDQYDTYVSLMLYAFDEYMFFDEEHCAGPLAYQVGIHRDYIRSTLHKDAEGAADVRSGYSALMLSHIDRIFEEIDRESAHCERPESEVTPSG